MEKGSEDELTVGGPAAMNGCSPEILYLLDPAQGLCIPEGFFDNVSHQSLLGLLQVRISDPKLLALINRFLKAGVMIQGKLEATEEGVPQGSSLSPLLANVCLHYVLDDLPGTL